MTVSLELRDKLKELLAAVVGNRVYYMEAPKEAEYPYYVFEFRRIGSDSGIDQYVFEVNAWDNHPTTSRIEASMDEIESGLDNTKEITDYFVLEIHKGDREPIPDEDKSIKRIRATFDLMVAEGSIS